MTAPNETRLPSFIQIAFGLGLLVLIVAGRTLPHLMNFAPVAAAGLFAGYLFSSRFVGGLVILSGMVASDLWIGMDDFGMRLLVYVAFLLPVILGAFLRTGAEAENRSRFRFPLRVFALGLGSSLVFFLVTNFGVWLGSGMYTHDLAGLGLCFVKALPFYRATALGDAFYLVVLFGLHHVVSVRFASRQPAVA